MSTHDSDLARLSLELQNSDISSTHVKSVKPSKPHIEVVDIKDFKKAAKTLEIAFRDDLYVRYLTSGINDTKLKEQLDLALFEATVYSTILSGLVIAVRDVEGEKEDPEAPFLAVACFERPRPRPDSNSKSLLRSLWSMYQGGYLKFIWLANKETRQRVLEEQSSMLEKFRSSVLGDEFESSWYLSDIGAIPKGRGKGLARALIDYVCHNYIDNYTPPSPDGDDDDFSQLENKDKTGVVGSNIFKTNEDSQLDSEIESYKFSFDLDSDNFTDYSGYSSASDSDASSSHSSWYYKEEDDILAQYDNRKNRGSQVGAPLYLESSHPRNKKIYQKLGFTYVKTVEIAQVTDKHGQRKTLTMDLMVRGVKGARWIKREEAIVA
ncbi:DEKNAAC100401 [Brettanomyces naardenensis]|uniref:DEKNAAC100401 n=1 Tax=Brettanomyces naardenensis TaxID=13370 RepID=A0A448YGG1_BRENA|nr:DEKNAAC100401 [Brettanomyces naardenensis]